jgi:hypothetical protein
MAMVVDCHIAKPISRTCTFAEGINKKRARVVEMVDSSWVLLILYTSIISLSLASPGQLE